MADRDVVIRIKASNLTKAEFDKARKQLNNLEKSAGLAGKKMGPLGQEVKRLSHNFSELNPATATASRLFGGAGVAVLGVTGAFAGLAAATGLGVRHIVDLGTELTTLRDKTGISLQGLQELKFVAEQTNVGFNSVTDAVVRLGRRTASGMGDAVKGVEALGLSVAGIVAAEPEKQFLTIVDALSEVENVSRRNAIAMQVFGDAGLQIIPLLESDVDGLVNSFHELDGAIEDDTLEAGRRLSDAFTDIKTAALGLADDALGPLVEILADVAEGFSESRREANAYRREIEALPTAKEQEARLLSMTGLMGPGALPTNQGRINELREEGRRQLELNRQFAEEQMEIFNRLFPPDGGDGGDAGGNIEKATERLKTFVKMQREGAKSANELLASNQMFAEALLEFQLNMSDLSVPAGAFRENIGGILDVTHELPVSARKWNLEIQEAVSETELLEQAQIEYNSALAAAADLAQLIGGSIGQLVGQTMAAGAALQNLQKLGGEGGILGGFGAAFSAGKGDATGFLGLLGGIGGVAGAAGPLIGLGTTLFQGLAGLFSKPPDLVRDAARDLGATISQEMADGILASGKPLQLAVAEVFRGGGFESADKFAEEIGDIFSGFSRGEFSKGEALGALQESIPLLIQNFDELGEQGLAQVGRITAAAKEMGFEFDELGLLIQETITEDTLAEMGLVGEMSVHRIRDAARELGVDFEFLFEKVQDTFAPSTLEDFAKEFGITTEHARELAAELGINMQTNLERMAASVGLTADEFLELEKAIEGSFFDKRDLSKEEILKFMEATGLSAKELADTLGVEVADGAGAVQDEQDKANEKIREGRDFARELRDALREAASAAGGIGGGLSGLRDLLENNTGGLQDAIG